MTINYTVAYECCAEVIATHSLLYPLDVRSLVKSYDIKLVRYSKLAKRNNMSIEEFLDFMPEYGLLEELNGIYKILYNDTLSEGAIRFTLLHELGHYLMNHHEDNKDNDNLANCFARNLIAPLSICKRLSINDATTISDYFGITLSAALTRLSFFGIDAYHIHKLNTHPIFQYRPYIYSSPQF